MYRQDGKRMTFSSELNMIHKMLELDNTNQNSLGRGSKKTKKKVVILLQPPSVYLPTPIGVKKATFLIFLGYFEMMFKPLLESEFFLRIFFLFNLVYLPSFH